MGIDVSKCAFYNDGKCDNPNGMACNCCNNAYCYYKELQQLKAENEELKENIKLQEDILKLTIRNNNRCLDEIEGIAKNGVKDDCGMPLDELSIILKLIKQAKEDKNEI